MAEGCRGIADGRVLRERPNRSMKATWEEPPLLRSIRHRRGIGGFVHFGTDEQGYRSVLDCV